MRRALIVLSFALALAGCGKQRVATQPDVPPLAPPAPPPRVIAPPETTEEPPAASPEPDRRPPRRAPTKNEGARETPAKPEPPKPQPASPEAPPPAGQPPPPSVLQTIPPASQMEMDRKARTLITQARRDLGRLNPASLNADGKGQFDTARRFVEQAEQALKEQNFVLALNLADKAATIAAVLVGR